MSKNLIALQNKFLGHGNTVYDLLSQLHNKQGYISDADIDRLAAEHNLPRAHVRSTAKFYEELGHARPATRVVKLCNGEACRAAGCDALIEDFEGRVGVSIGSTNERGIRFEHVACLGYCGQGPNAMIDGVPVSLAKDKDRAQLAKSLETGAAHGLQEPINAFYPPSEGRPCILLRHFGKGAQDIEEARRLGVYASLEKAVRTMTPQAVVDEVKASQLRGRGGAGFPAGIKFQTVVDSQARDRSGRKFVVVNFDEGDAGSYIDKELIEHDPHSQLEGILLAAYACGAQKAFIYARFEYPRARAQLQNALEQARAAGLVGAPLFDSPFQCEIEVIKGQGAYICGEETSLLRSIEGVPALVSIRPPFPAQAGLWGCPTAVNNVETIQNLPWIIQNGGAAYAKLGHERSRGTKAISLNHRVKRPGVYEVELGITLREILELAGGMADGQEFKAIQVGGPLGGILPASKLDTPLDFEAMAAQKAIVGHAGIVVYSQEDDLWKIGRGLMEFCAIESCGKCFPCRIGSVRGTELMDQIASRGASAARMQLLEELCETMKYGSLCAMGGMTPAPIECILQYFPEEWKRFAPTSAEANA